MHPRQIIIGLVIVVGLLFIVTYFTANPVDPPSNDSIGTTTPTVGDEPTAHPKSRRRTYRGVVTLPTPCHSLTSNIRIGESYPEYVTVLLTSEQNTDEVCIQVLDEREFIFTVDVHERATIRVMLDGEEVEANLEEITVEQNTVVPVDEEQGAEPTQGEIDPSLQVW